VSGSVVECVSPGSGGGGGGEIDCGGIYISQYLPSSSKRTKAVITAGRANSSHQS